MSPALAPCIGFLGVGGLPADLTLRQGIAGIVLVSGAALVVVGLVRLVVQEYRETKRGSGADATQDAAIMPPVESPRPVRWPIRAWLPALLLLVAAGGALRLDGLAAKTLTHTEAIVPNIAWPPEVSFPPARTTFYDTFWWHFHSEGHPQAYYFLMWAWTKVLGTGLVALRLPSALFGIGCIVLLYWLGTLAYDRRVGLVSAGLLAFNGLHIYWSQYARMYVMACFLALLSTCLLLHLARAPSRRLGWEIAYVLASWLAAYTQVFFWPVLVAHALWGVLQRDGPWVRRTLGLQALVVVLAASSLAHTIHLGDDVTLPGPSWSFVQQYLSFGFLFEPDLFSLPTRVVPPLAGIAVLLLALVCLAYALRVPPNGPASGTDVEPIRATRVLPVVVGSALVIGAFAILAHRRNLVVAAVSVVPFLALLMPTVGSRIHALIGARWSASTDGPLSARRVSLPVLAAFVPAGIVLALSFWTSLLAPRAFLMFVPYLLVVLAAGIVGLTQYRWLAVPLWIALVAAHVTSVAHFRAYPSEQIDYAALGEQVDAAMETGDLVFVVPELWVTTPIFYYLDDQRATYVGHDYADAVRSHPEARVWLFLLDSVQWGPYGTTSPEMKAALSGFRLQEEVTSRRGRALLYVRESPPS